MPIYEYQCTKCGHHLEALQKISDKPLRECPECSRHTLKRLMSAPLFRLAGSGWYETDFKGDNETRRNLVGEKAEAEGSKEAKAEAKPDAKPETKADAKPEVTREKADKPARTMVTKPSTGKSATKRKAAGGKRARKPGRR